MAAEDRKGMAIALTCKDMAKSVEFYRERLGFTMKESWPSEAAPQWCNMVLHEQSVMLGAALDPDNLGELCAHDPDALPVYKQAAEAFRDHPAGVGVHVYLQVDDPDGYRLVFHTPVTMTSCQSCGMPLTDAQPGQIYCAYCVDEHGKLRPYEAIFEGTVTGYFMGMQKLDRAAAEKAAKEHLSKLPAWTGRG